MQNLFDEPTYRSVIDRINSLSTRSQRQWGKMEVAQMLAHCKETFRFPLSEIPAPRMLMGYLVGWALKSHTYNETPFRKNMPTADMLKFTDERDFLSEKASLLRNIDSFYSKGPANVDMYPHPLFGKLTSEQWGKFMFKHLDHHLQQFGV